MTNKQEYKVDIHKKDLIRCTKALILCVLVVLTSFQGLVIALTHNEGHVYQGLANMRYFTYDSNIFVGIAAALCIPYQIDGLRNRNYHLPRWVVNILYIAVCTVNITFALALLIILPYKGLYATYVQSESFLPHLVTPLLSMFMFVNVDTDHKLNRKMIAFAFIPLLHYGEIYIRKAFITKTWNDHYHLSGILPIWLSLLIVLISYFLIAMILRYLHNRNHEKKKEEEKEYYLKSDEVAYPTIDEAIKNLALRNLKLDRDGDLVLPRRIILMMKEKYQSNLNIEELLKIYVDYYYSLKDGETKDESK